MALLDDREALATRSLHVDAQRDEVEELRAVTSPEPYGAIVTHRRCGARYQIEFGTRSGA